MTPSIGSLERIALALGVSLGKFFAEPEAKSIGLVRGELRQKLISTWSPVTIEALGSMGGTSKIEPVMITMAPGGRTGKYPTTHVGEKFALVIEGEVSLTLEDEVHVLHAGDAITLTSATPHQWENTGNSPARLVIVAVH